MARNYLFRKSGRLPLLTRGKSLSALKIVSLFLGLVSLPACNMNVGSLGDISAKRSPMSGWQPSIRSIAPTTGNREGGTLITIEGEGFDPDAKATLGGKSCVIVEAVTKTNIKCVTTPASSEGTADVVVTNPNGLNSILQAAFTFIRNNYSLPPPTVSSISPSSGPSSGGTLVAIQGKDFVATPEVKIGGVNCNPVVFISSNELTCVTGKNDLGTRTVAVVVINPDLQAGAIDMAFTYYDDLPTVNLGDFSPTERNENSSTGTATLNVTLSDASTQTITVNFSTAGTATQGADYVLDRTSPITFNPGDTTKTITLSLIDDPNFEGSTSETVILQLTGATNADLGASGPKTFSIVENDPLPTASLGAFSMSSLDEDATTVTVSVVLSASSSLSFTTDINLSGTATSGADYTLNETSPLTFVAGETSKSLVFTIVEELNYEQNETVTLQLSNPQGGTLGPKGPITFTINNDDPIPTINLQTLSAASINENAVPNTVTINVTLTGTSFNVVRANITLSGTATSGVDYTVNPTSQVQFDPGDLSKTITFTITNESDFEPDETVSIELNTPFNGSLGSAGPQTFNILNDDLPPGPALSGTLYHDVDGDGSVAGDWGKAGWTIEVYTDNNSDGRFDPIGPFNMTRSFTQIVTGTSTTIRSTAHGLITSDRIRIHGAPAELAGSDFTTTKINDNEFSIPFDSSSGLTYSGGGTWTLANGDRYPIFTTITDANGVYSIDTLQGNGTYFIRALPRQGWGLSYIAPTTTNEFLSVTYSGTPISDLNFGYTECNRYLANASGNKVVQGSRFGIMTIQANTVVPFSVVRVDFGSFSFFDGTSLASGNSVSSRINEFNSLQQRVDIAIKNSDGSLTNYKVNGLTALSEFEFQNSVDVDIGGSLALQIWGSQCDDTIAVLDDPAYGTTSDAKRIMVGNRFGNFNSGVNLSFKGILYHTPIINSIFGNPTITRVEAYGNGGDDIIRIDDGTLQPGHGLDMQSVVTGGTGDDMTRSGAGKGTVHGGDGNNFISSGPADDVFTGGNNTDFIYCGGGASRASGGYGDDFILGGPGDQSVLRGLYGQDRISGGPGSNGLLGDEGTDIYYSDGGDTLIDGFEINGGDDALEPVFFGDGVLPGLMKTYWDDQNPADGYDTIDELIRNYFGPPVVLSVNPSSGPSTGGTVITITGYNFRAPASVKTDTLDCSPVTFVSSTELRCTTGNNTSGTRTVDVTVTNPDTQTGSKASAFSFVGAPTVTSINPTSGKSEGGTPITIGGTGFLPLARVFIGDIECTGVSVESPIEIRCTTGGSSTETGKYAVVVRNTDNQEGTLSDGFTYYHAPDVVGISPNTGWSAGGYTVTISGTDFRPGSVVIGVSSCAITSSTLFAIECTTGVNSSGTNYYNVRVDNSDAQWDSLSNGFRYTDAPNVISISPTSGPLGGGNGITLTGADFRTGATIKLGNLACTNPSVLNESTITCLAPSGAGCVNAVVTNTDDGQVSTNPPQYCYAPGPTVSSISPATVVVVSTVPVTITGTNFVANALAWIDSSPCTSPVVVDATHVTCTTPNLGVGTYSVKVQNPDTQSDTKSGLLTYAYAPQVLSVSPANGRSTGGQSITIGGNYFKSGATVLIGVVPCDVTFAGATVVCTTRAGTPGGPYKVTVTNHPDELSGEKLNAYTYNWPPQVDSINPTSGPLGGGTAVTIQGDRFDDVSSTVTIGGIPCNVTRRSIGQYIYCTTQAHTIPDLYDVVVTNGDTQTGTLPDGFTYQNSGTWLAMDTATAPAARNVFASVWTGSVYIIYGGWVSTDDQDSATGGIYNPVTDSWVPTPVPDPVALGRIRPQAVWTGKEMIVWGGITDNINHVLSNTGLRFDPVTNIWTELPATNAPAPRYAFSTVWTGKEMIVWAGEDTWNGGSYIKTGGAYNPRENLWDTSKINLINAVGSPSTRRGASAVWTGRHMIVWGGFRVAGATYEWPKEGGLYDPHNDIWEPGANYPNFINAGLTSPIIGRGGHRAVWTGREMIMFGGANNSDYRHCTVPIFQCGPPIDVGHGIFNSGAMYYPYGSQDPIRPKDSWIATPQTNDRRQMHAMVWTGSKVILWGGGGGWGKDEWNVLKSGDVYDPISNTFQTIPVGGANYPQARYLNDDYSTDPSVWTGKEMIIWGGVDSTYNYINTGSRYTPPIDENKNTWSPMADMDVNTVDYNERFFGTAVWTGSEMIAWGGYNENTYWGINTGGKYDPITNTWIATPTTNAPTRRWRHSAVWTGKHMIILAGYGYSTSLGDWEDLNDGGAYDPALNAWDTSKVNLISGTSAPSKREHHPVLWTGFEMITWGGLGPGYTALENGGRYYPYKVPKTGGGFIEADTWQTMAAPPVGGLRVRWGHTLSWTGREMVLIGGFGLSSGGGCFSGRCYDGSRYDPASDTWTEYFFFGGIDGRGNHSTVWTGKHIIFWGGASSCSDVINCTVGTNDGIVYEPYKPVIHSQKYERIYNGSSYQTGTAPAGRYGHTTVWTGKEMIIWGGWSGTLSTEVGKLSFDYYHPTWQKYIWKWEVSDPSGSPLPRYFHSAVWTGKTMLIFGGWGWGGAVYANGGIYQP